MPDTTNRPCRSTRPSLRRQPFGTKSSRELGWRIDFWEVFTNFTKEYFQLSTCFNYENETAHHPLTCRTSAGFKRSRQKTLTVIWNLWNPEKLFSGRIEKEEAILPRTRNQLSEICWKTLSTHTTQWISITCCWCYFQMIAAYLPITFGLFFSRLSLWGYDWQKTRAHAWSFNCQKCVSLRAKLCCGSVKNLSLLWLPVFFPLSYPSCYITPASIASSART